ncbi:MAG: beta strand repeat-containing protein [Eubacterium sp.]
MKKIKARKWLSILLCIVLAISMFPVATSAAEGDVEYLYCDENGENWQTGTKADGEYTLVTSDDTSWSSGWYVVEGSITNSNRISVSGDVHLILKDGCTLNATSGILVSSGNSLTIYGQSLGTGKLIATAWTDGGDAGIGGVHHSTAGSITINGGNIEATGYNGGAGIGGGHAGAPQSVTINGGNVIANGGACGSNGSGAGIGCGYAVSGGTVKINGGTVVANGNGKGNQNAPGIGGGSSISSDNTTVIINGGVVTATCLDNSVSGISGNFSTGTDGNAVIFTNSISDQSGKDNWNGVIFEGNSGSVYGTSITLTEDFTIESDITLTVSDGQTLIISDGVTLTNNGTIANNGTIVNNDTITNNGTYVGTLPMVPVMYLDKDCTEQTAICNVITADNIGEYTTINEGWYVIKGEITYSGSVCVNGDVHLILADNCNFSVNSGNSGNAAVQVIDSNSLTIYAQSTESNMGALNASASMRYSNNYYYPAAIGGGHDQKVGNITIHGGRITACGGGNGAGIGGAAYRSGGGSNVRYNGGGNITITGGIVTATNENGNAGIGSGAPVGTYINEGSVFSTGTNGNAIIYTCSINVDSDDTSSWNGVIFYGTTGKVYGTTVKPSTDFEIPNDYSLDIPEGTTLNASDINVTNNGTIYVNGSFVGTSDNIYYPLTVVNASANGDLTDYNSKTYGKAGSGITLTPNAPIGQALGEWNSTPTVTVSDSNTFTMPDSALTITAQYINTPTYTVTIPAKVELGEDITISATGVNVVSGSQLEVKITDTSDASDGFMLENSYGEIIEYEILNSSDNSKVALNDKVLTVAGGVADNSASASYLFSKTTDKVKHSGTYKGTVTFTVSVEAVS